MPTIQVRDITLLERLKRIKPVPDDYYDDVLYELLKKAESKNEGRPKLLGLDDLPRLVVEEVRKALDGRLTELVKSAILPTVSNLSLEIPVELSVRVRLRFEPVFDVSPSKTEALVENRDGSSSNGGANSVGANDRIAELDVLERQVFEFLRRQGGCWEGSAYSLVKTVIGDIDWGLEKRLRRHLVRRDGRLCLPEAVAQQ